LYNSDYQITIGTPFYNSSYYVNMYLKHVYDLDYPKKLINLIFVNNESTDDTEDKLVNFCKKYKNKYRSAKVLFTKHIEERGKFKGHSNIVESVKAFIKENKTDLLFIGSDCFPTKDSINKLIELFRKGADIAAGITLVGGAQTQIKGRLIKGIPVLSAYSFDKITGKFHSLSRIKKDKPYVSMLGVGYLNKIVEVDGIGTGLSLIKKEVLDNVSFGISKRYGEDLYFCMKARMLGYKIMIDTSLLYNHWHYSYSTNTNQDGMYFIVKGIRNKETGEINPIIDKNAYKSKRTSIY